MLRVSRNSGIGRLLSRFGKPIIIINNGNRHTGKGIIMKVFISHAQADEQLAKTIAQGLEANGLDVFIDEQQIMPGDNWAAKIAAGLEESQAMVVLLTRDALKSRSVRSDIDYALGNINYSGRLIPVLAESKETLPREEIPWILRHLDPITLPEHKQEEGIRQIARVIKTTPKFVSR